MPSFFTLGKTRIRTLLVKRFERITAKTIAVAAMPKVWSQKKVKVYRETVLLNFPLNCSKCKRETEIGVLKYKIVVSDEPDA